MYAGQGIGTFRDIPGAADVIQSLVKDTRMVLTKLPQRVRLS
jgi:hypothetical protein